MIQFSQICCYFSTFPAVFLTFGKICWYDNTPYEGQRYIQEKVTSTGLTHQSDGPLGDTSYAHNSSQIT